MRIYYIDRLQVLFMRERWVLALCHKPANDIGKSLQVLHAARVLLRRRHLANRPAGARCAHAHDARWLCSLHRALSR